MADAPRTHARSRFLAQYGKRADLVQQLSCTRVLTHSPELIKFHLKVRQFFQGIAGVRLIISGVHAGFSLGILGYVV